MPEAAVPVGPPRSVRIEIPADRAFLVIARSAAAAVAAWAGFGLDGVDDVRIAVWEASGLVSAYALPGAAVTVELEADPGYLQARLRVPTPRAIPTDGSVPQEHAWAWALLEALMNDVTTSWNPGTGVTTVTLIARTDRDATRSGPSPGLTAGP